MHKYDYSRPILYNNAFEEQESFELGVKRVFRNKTYPAIGKYPGTTFYKHDHDFDELLANAIPWSELRLQFVKPPVELYF